MSVFNLMNNNINFKNNRKNTGVTESFHQFPSLYINRVFRFLFILCLYYRGSKNCHDRGSEMSPGHLIDFKISMLNFVI